MSKLETQMLEWLETQGFTPEARETILPGFAHYIAQLQQWNGHYSLVSPGDMAILWQRHILDSLQLLPYLQHHPMPCIDVGSGAGFPGMLLALCGIAPMTLVESNHHKSAFLQHVAMALPVPPHVHCGRMEALPIESACVFLARGVTAITKLLAWTQRDTTLNHIFWLLKGERVQEEIAEAQKIWDFELTEFPSHTHPTGWIVRLRHVRKRRL